MTAAHPPTAVGAQRRIRALVAKGWTVRALDEQLGGFVAQNLLAGHPITVHNHRRVADLFDRLAFVDGGSERSRRRAAREGWAPPLAWDDDTIDDPAAVPVDVARRPWPGNRPIPAWWFDDFRELVEYTGSVETACARAGVTVAAAAQRWRRHHLGDPITVALATVQGRGRGKGVRAA